MSYLDHIKKCNAFTSQNVLPFLVAGEQMGWIRDSILDQLERWPDVFQLMTDISGNLEKQAITLHSDLGTPDERTAAIKPVTEALYEERVIPTWVGEPYAVTNTYGEQPRLLIERAAVSYFGVRGYGVHLNGLVKKEDGVYIWCARRAKDKPYWPGYLDQLVAGGQPAGIGLMENVIKESAEEANIPPELASQSELVSTLHYRTRTERGTQIDTLFNYDLWLPEDFEPQNTDGEVDEFILMRLEEMPDITANSEEFKANCNLVNIDLLIRFGLIDEQHPDHSRINSTLYAPAQLAQTS